VRSRRAATTAVATTAKPACCTEKGAGDHAAAACTGAKADCSGAAKLTAGDPAVRNHLSPSMQNLMGKVDELRRRRGQ
jgi:hypothetical protein